ncbi:MAG: hypothetical protein NXI32_11060 [bacterium]|nr:hypothetical protein [bacterium]
MNRDELRAILSATRFEEDFETFDFARYGSEVQLIEQNVAELSSDSIFFDQGPGLVIPQVRFVNLQRLGWTRDGLEDLESQKILSNSGPSLEIEFPDGDVTAFGLDFSTISSIAWPDTALIDIFDAGDNVLAAYRLEGLRAGVESVFWGYLSDSPISSVRITGTSESGQPSNHSPFIDNLEFGVAVPEPASLNMWAMLGALSLCTRRITRSGWFGLAN